MGATAIAIDFCPPPRLAVNEAELAAMLGLNGRSELAKKKAIYKLCLQHNIKPLPGRVFPLKKIEAACAS